MRNLLAGIALPLILTGCGLPPALTIASTVADGFSYIVSGKSVSDHALSVVASQDCAMLRLLDDGEICVDHADESTVLLASADSPDTWQPVDDGLTARAAPVAPGADSTAPKIVAVAAMPASSTSRAPGGRFADAAPLLKPTNLGNATVVAGAPASTGAAVTVLGSYRDPANAERAVARMANLYPRVVAAAARGATLYRVVSDISVARARAAGIGDAWQTAPGIQLASTL